MKTKGKYKKSLSLPVPDQTPTARPRAAALKVAGNPRLPGLSAPKFNERTGNVYENKGGGEEVKESMAMSNILSRTPPSHREPGALPRMEEARESAKSGERSQEVIENKGCQVL